MQSDRNICQNDLEGKYVLSLPEFNHLDGGALLLELQVLPRSTKVLPDLPPPNLQHYHMSLSALGLPSDPQKWKTPTGSCLVVTSPASELSSPLSSQAQPKAHLLTEAFPDTSLQVRGPDAHTCSTGLGLLCSDHNGS